MLSPVSAIKIDRSFVAGLPSAEDAAIVRSILVLAGDLGLDVTAEGIETEAQREALVKLGCELGQGFLFAPPMASSTLLRLLETWNARGPEREVLTRSAPVRPARLSLEARESIG